MKLIVDEMELRSLIEEVIESTLQQLEAERAKCNGRLGYTEPEAAAMLGIQPHVLRDCRLRGEISARKAGKRFIYSRDTLLRFLADGE